MVSPKLNGVCFCLLMVLIFGMVFSADSPIFRLVYYDDFPPFSWKNAEGEMQGFFIDFFDELLGKRMGFIVIHEGYPWQRAQEMVRLGQADAFCTLDNPERRTYTVIGEVPVVIDQMVGFVSSTHSDLDRIADAKELELMKGYTFVDYIGSGWGRQHLGDQRVIWVQTSHQALEMVASQRADLFIHASLVGRYQILQSDGWQIIHEVSHPFETIYFFLCIGKASPFSSMMPQIDEQIGLFKESQRYQELKRIYWGSPE